jgi:hypothetical protein
MTHRSRRATSTALLAAILTLATAGVAQAIFTVTAKGGPMAISSATLAAPATVTAEQTACKKNQPVTISVSWSKTTSSFATSYTLERATATNGPYTAVATGISIALTSYEDTSPTLESSTTYYYRVAPNYHSWSTPSTPVKVKTLNRQCQ